MREAVAALFGKMMADKLNGPRVCSPPLPALSSRVHLSLYSLIRTCSAKPLQVRIILSKFLPIIFTDAMRDNAEASVTMFEGVSAYGYRWLP